MKRERWACDEDSNGCDIIERRGILQKDTVYS